MLLYALALLCFRVIISPTSWASARRWRWLGSRFSRLVFPLHQQNIWESKHKAGEAEWESQPEGLARGRAQEEGRGHSEHGPVSPPCTLGEHLCRMEPSQVTARGGKAGKPAQHRNFPAMEAAWEQEHMQWRKNLVMPGAQRADTAHPRVKGGSFSHAWGSSRVRHGAAPAPAPLFMCTVQLLDTEMCCALLGSSVIHGVMAGAQGRQPGPAGQGMGVC